MNPDWLAAAWPAPVTVRAFTTTRAGGVSSGPWSKLNLGMHTGDDTGDVRINRDRLEQHLPARPRWLNQVHGCTVRQHARGVRVEEEGDALVAFRPGRVCAVLTAFIKRAPLINQPVHYFRVFVAEASREHDLAATLVRELRDDLLQRHAAGEITDSVGIFTEVENEYVAKYRNEAVWASTRFVFIGMNEGHQQCRVIYFPGATVFDLA